MHYRNLLTSVLILGSGFTVFADEIDDALGDAASTASTSATTSSVALPSFTPITIPAPFFEQFTKDWNKRWVPSKAKKDVGKDAKEEWAYVGRWAVEEPSVLKGIEGDEGLVVKDPAAHHAISAKFSKPLDNKGKTLVVQYEVKLQNGLECGGAYLKLLKDNKALHAEEFSNASPYVIMFGPDKCGATNKVHFIFKHKDPKTGEYEEKHLTSPPMVKTTKQSTLYTLIVKPDQTYEIRIDGKEAKKGSLFEDFLPPVNPPKMIDDENDKKPDDWVDQAMIPDPKATKPEDWDEDAPYEIEDEKATKPADWLEDEPISIPDPEAKKPEDWDDEEDGDWIAPTVPNPKCGEVAGCGPWKKPMIANPAYKGKWTAPLVDNPDYKGVWAPRQILNPKYSEDKTPANFEPIGAVGFELWTMQKDILFDNIYIGHSIEDAEKIQKESFDIKKASEQEQDKEPEPVKHEDEDRETIASLKEDPVKYIRQRLELFFAIAKADPVTALRLHPDVAGSLLVVFGTLFALLFGLFSSSPAPVVKKAKAVATEKKKAVEKRIQEVASEVSEASGTENESKPRTTRRSSKKT